MPIVKRNERSTEQGNTASPAYDREGLLEQLGDPSPFARRRAAEQIAEFPEVSAPLVEQLGREEDATVREVIFTTLARRGDREASIGLVDCLRSEDASLRNGAMEAMRHLSGEVDVIMERLLADPDPDVRILAINVLESLRHEKVEYWLREIIENDPHVNVCGTALDLLVELGTADSETALENLIARFPEEPYIAFAAEVALKRIRCS